ncbi:MAG: ATP-dependent RNA helicase HrpA [Alcanivoracaceae bacterium]|nr:ATP-dependent RNA helicase HrpA [Alcanivoracaceae bacterium]
MSTERLAEIKKMLQTVMIKDRHRFQQRWRALSRKSTSSDAEKNYAAALDALHLQCIASAERVERRRARLPTLHWPDLPVVERLEDLQQAIEAHQVVVVAGETGSGKTTQLPKICLSLGRGVTGMIGHTQPRRLAARAVANRIAEECQTQLGDLVGYRVRFTDQVSDESLVKVLTDGMLLAEIQKDPYLNQYDTIIIDEAHERSLNIDFLLGFLKRLLPKRQDLKVIITSATIDHQRFASHFSGAPVLEVSGRTFPVTVHYRPAEQERDITRQIEDVLREIESSERQNGRPSACDVLVFLSGERDIREAHRHLKKCEFRDTEILPLYARLTPQEQQRVFSSHRGRRVILSTNVAETSLTVPGIRYVIDAGTARISRYSVQAKVQRLPIEAISKASAEQRKGRSGRVMPGDCFRLYDEDDFVARPAFTDPEIQRTNLAAVILQMTDLRLGEVENFPFIDAPDGRLVRDGYRLLEELGAWQKNALTPLGKQLARLPLDPRLGRMLLASATQGCFEEVLIIVAALATQDPRERPQEASQQADQAHQPFVNKESDFIFYVNLWLWAEQQREELSRNQYEKLLKKTFLSPMRMREWRDVHHQLVLLAKELKLERNKESASFDQIHQALLSGLLGNIIKRTDEGEWLSTRNRKPSVWPGSALSKTKSSWLMAAEQVETSRLFARCVAKIEPEWIEKQAEHLLKRSYLEPHWSKKRGAVMAKEQVSLFGLIISAGRRVQYGKHDPALARELLIREGLVEGQLMREPEFVRLNRELIETLEDVEHKLRRKDLLADEEKRYGFYELNLPDGMLNLADVEHWYRRHATPTQKKQLLMDEAFLLGDTPNANVKSFPDSLSVDGIQFALEYQFDPAGGRDGVTLVVPVQGLPVLNADRLDWLVPGLLNEKIEALIRGLPKARRRHFVPVPDYVRALMDILQPGNEALLPAMTRELQRMTGVRIEQEEWPVSGLSEHLRFHLRVVNGDEVLASGQELAALQKQFSEQSAASLQAAIEQPDISARDWQFGELPLMREEQRDGLSMRVWPGLEDAGDKVTLTLFSEEVQAEFQHGWALARLIGFRMAIQMRELEQKLARMPGCQKVIAKNKKFKDALLLRLVYEHFDVSVQVRSAEVFQSVFDQGRADFLATAVKRLAAIDSLLNSWRNILQKLDKNFPLAWAHAHADIKTQLDELFFSDWIFQVPTQWLLEYPRYLKAIELRLEKLGGQLSRDRAFALELAPLYEQLERRAGSRPIWQWPEPLLEYRFWLEEYRISLFAQQVGTKVSVSAKRLRQQWEQC